MSLAQGYGTGFRAPKVDVHSFAMVPRADIPRSSFRMQHQNKLTFSASNLIPMFLEEVLPGDSWKVNMSAFVRMATPIFPVMDNLDLETWFFFVPNRLVWTHWYRFMGEQENPSDSIAYNIPQVISPSGGFAQKSLYDYYGLPCAGQTGVGNTIGVSALPFRGYSIIYNNWFKDQNLQNAMTVGSTQSYGYAAMDDGPDVSTQYFINKVCKRHDMFTACLPFTQKGAAVTIPVLGNATVKTSGSALYTGVQQAMTWLTSAGAAPPSNQNLMMNASSMTATSTTAATSSGNALYPSNLYADLSTAATATINALRLAFQTQRLLERDARSGTRYPEIIKGHFGVISPDARQMRPEFLQSGKTPVTFAPVPQTVPATLSGTSNPPMGQLAGVGIAQGRNHGFSYAATEHGYIHGFCTVRQDMIYQQGLRRHWKRLTRYDFYFPVFAMLGERAVLNSEIYSDGSINDNSVFGYNENWVEYRTRPSYTCAYFRSTTTTPLDSWHLAEKFTALPTLGSTFITDSTVNQVQRAVSAGAAAADQQFLADFFFDAIVARVMPAYSVPGLIDHF